MNAPPVMSASNSPPKPRWTPPSSVRLNLTFGLRRVSSLLIAIIRFRKNRFHAGSSSNLARNPRSRFFRIIGTRET